MPLSPLPFGTYNIQGVIGLDGLRGVGHRSSLWQIMEAFCRHSEGLASRVAFGRTGAIVLITIPDDVNSGRFYWYDSHTKMFYSFDFERQDEFNAAFFDIVMTAYDLHMLIDITLPAEKKPVQYQGQSTNGRRHRRRHGRTCWRGNDQQQQHHVGEVPVAA